MKKKGAASWPAWDSLSADQKEAAQELGIFKKFYPPGTNSEMPMCYQLKVICALSRHLLPHPRTPGPRSCKTPMASVTLLLLQLDNEQYFYKMLDDSNFGPGQGFSADEKLLVFKVFLLSVMLDGVLRAREIPMLNNMVELLGYTHPEVKHFIELWVRDTVSSLRVRACRKKKNAAASRGGKLQLHGPLNSSPCDVAGRRTNSPRRLGRSRVRAFGRDLAFRYGAKKCIGIRRKERAQEKKA